MGHVNTRDDQQSRREESKHQAWHREAVVMVQQNIEQPVAEFHQWIA